MREVTKKIIKDFDIINLDCDFMGYKVERKENLSFHHLVIPRREASKYKINNGYVYWNGAVLRQDTAHEYLHIIEFKDYDMFFAITSEMINMKMRGNLDVENLRYINDILTLFEREHCSDINKKGKHLIKEQYISGRLFR